MSPAGPDLATAMAWVELRSDARLRVVGKVFDGHRTAAAERAPLRTLVDPVVGSFVGMDREFGVTLTRTADSYFLTWIDGDALFGRFWNETLTGTLSDRFNFTARAGRPKRVEAVYDPHRDRVLVVWRTETTLFTGTVSADLNRIIRTGVSVAAQAMYFDVAANLKISTSPAFLVTYVMGRTLTDREVRSFTLSGPALGTLTKGPERIVSTASAVYELVSVSYNGAFNGFVSAYTQGERIEAVAHDHHGTVERRHALGRRRLFWRRSGGSGANVRHPERWYSLDCPINPNGLAVLLLTQTVESPSERFAELQVYARPVRGLGTDSGVTLGTDRLLGTRSADLSRRLNFHIGVHAAWNGVFKIVWERDVRGADLDTRIYQEVVFAAVNADGVASD